MCPYESARFDLENGGAGGVYVRIKPIQVGKKARNGKYGACFFTAPSPDLEKENNDDRDSVVTTTNDTSNNCEFILAARPNGRLWEANGLGVVYR